MTWDLCFSLQRKWRRERPSDWAFTLYRLCAFAQFAEPMTATLADLCELPRPPSAFTTFQGHFLSSFLTLFNGGFCRCAAARVSLASWAAKRALNLLRASQ